MRWVLLIAGTLVGLVALIALVGWLLPVEHVASRSVVVRGAPDEVWSTITDVEGFPSWRGDVTSAQPLPDENGHRRWEERGTNGTIVYEAVEFEPPRRLVSRIASTGLAFGGSWTYELTPADGGTEVSITERGEVYNPIFRFLSRFVFGHTATMDSFLKDLERKQG
jgi:hypothetical protein